jgi:hypothetical protein
VKFAFIQDMEKENERGPRSGRFPVAFMCEMLAVSRAGYYAWKKRLPSAREKLDVTLTTLIVAIHQGHKGRYGIDRIHADLARNGYRVSPKRVRRLARAAGLACVHPRPYKATTVQDQADPRGLVDLVGRDFVPAARNELWYGDITYIHTAAGWAYLVVTWNQRGVVSRPDAGIPVASPQADGDGGLAGGWIRRCPAGGRCWGGTSGLLSGWVSGLIWVVRRGRSTRTGAALPSTWRLVNARASIR